MLHVWERRILAWFRWESQKESDHLEELDVGGRTVLKWIIERQDVVITDWIYLALDRDQWPALLNTVMNIQVP
jgi:hypothetical protein